MPTLFFADLVRELCQDGGTGPLTPAGAVPGHRRFADAVPAGAEFHYAVAGIARPEQWEVGTGRIEDGRLVRGTIASSSSDGGAVDFLPGLKTIALTVAAGWYAASDTATAALADAVAGKQPLPPAEAVATFGREDDLVTLRRGDGWTGLPLSALAFRDAAGCYRIDGPLATADGTSRMRLTATGAGFGTDAPARDLHVVGSFAEIARFETGAARGSGNMYLGFNDAAGAKGFLGYGGADDVFWIFNQVAAPLYFGTNNAVHLAIDTAGHTRPGADNLRSLGVPSHRWSTVYAASGAINTSDARDKLWQGAASEAELRAARRIADELGFFQWHAAIADKGAAAARRHFGVRAQAVWTIMAEEQLIEPIDVEGRPGTTPYAFLCWDEWTDESRADGEACDRFGIRPDQLALFLIAMQERRIAALEAAT